ncbi:MAG: hypothetical protein KF688_14965 [Pirellulales bacterium]|nr:hypothetical protein [Pirellulales bacterium]
MAATLETNKKAKKAAISADAPLAEQATRTAFWTADAPSKVRNGDAAAFLAYLAGRKRPVSVATLCRAADTPLAWGLAVVEFPAATQELIALAGLNVGPAGKGSLKPKTQRRLADALATWLDWSGEAAARGDLGFAVASLAAAHLLPLAAAATPPAQWWSCLDALARQAASAGDEPLATTAAASMLAQQLLAIELPVTLAYLFPEIAVATDLRRRAADRLAEATEELLNGEGLPHAATIGGLLPLVACWTRLAATGSAMKKSPWTKRAANQYGWLVRQAVRWSTPGGRSLLSDPATSGWSADFLQAALRLGGDRGDAAAAEETWGRGWVGKLAGAGKTHETPDPSDSCEWSQLSLLRTGWSSKDASVAVDSSGAHLRLEAIVGKQQVFCGQWRVELAVDGQSIPVTGTWEETCWFSDADVDFLELSLELGQGRRIDRQIMLAREQRFLWLADYFVAPAGELRYAGSLSLGPNVRWEPERETRDGLLGSSDAKYRVLPVALAEWRTDPRGGELTGDAETLRWSATRTGTTATAPLVIDLHPARSLKPCTWRQLTVAELLEIKSPDDAVAFRAQSGKDQWLFYRSNGPRGNRTFMGQNTSSEFVAGRFCPESGLLDELVEIEG